jgi:hypothetical protein
MFYTYLYRDPRPSKNLQAIYAGKGQDRRAWVHWEKRVKHNPGFGHILAMLRRDGLTPVIEIVQEFADEAEAFFDEVRLIAEHGRRDLKTGTLFNLTDGGEGFGGVVRTPEWAQRISTALSTPAHITRQKQQADILWARPEWREKTVAAIRTALKDPEVISRREAGKAAFIHTPEFAATMSAATTKMWQDPAYAEKVVAAQTKVQGTPEARAGKSDASMATWQKPDVREKRQGGIAVARGTAESRAKTRAQATAQWADPDYAAMQTANNREIANRPDVKAAKAAALKARWADPVWKAAFLAKRGQKKLAPPEIK